MAGFTLTELIMVMLMVAILIGIGIPSFMSVTNSNRISTEVNGLLGDLQFARAEAIKEGQPVTVCVSSNGTSCDGAANLNWNDGWIVFSDVNGNKAVDAGDVILKVQTAFTGTDTFTADLSNAISFNREGFAQTGAGANTVTIFLHAKVANAASTRCLQITPVGMMATETHGNSITAGNTVCT